MACKLGKVIFLDGAVAPCGIAFLDASPLAVYGGEAHTIIFFFSIGAIAPIAIPIGATAPIGKKTLIIGALRRSTAIGLASKEAIPDSATAPS